MRRAIRVRIFGSVVGFGLIAIGLGSRGCLPVGPPEPPPPGNDGLTGKYVGSERCMICHTNTHKAWNGTLHAHALETLEAIEQDTNSSCVGCHTVGYGEPGGFVDRATTNDLAGVGCEACHGAARDHVEDVSNVAKRPPKDISSSVCGACHQGSHHPNFEEWNSSHHSTVTDSIADGMVAGGFQTTSCGPCHSGDVFVRSVVKNEVVENDDYLGVPKEDLNAVTCAVCHHPHAQTGNAVDPGDGRDFQLRWREVASPIPTNTVDAATDPGRFNLCGQCHRSRGNTWESSRGPHHSVQSNVYVGEMPSPLDMDDEPVPLVLSRTSIHSFAKEQCSTCHQFRQDFQDDQAPAIAGHTFMINNAGCATSGCHPSADAAFAAQNTIKAEVDARLDAILARLGDPADWEYSSNGGPADQGTVTDGIKQVRFLYYYVYEDHSGGVHNPAYVRDMLDKAEALLTDEGL